MIYLDSIFNISSERTLWSIGNHDDDNITTFEKHTGRRNYYSYYSNGVTFLVLDTETDDSKIIGEQLKFVRNTLDTIEDSKNVIIMTHKLIWLYGNSGLRAYGEERSNVKIGDKSWNIKKNNFFYDIYPRLTFLESKGVNILCLGGDLGVNASVFEYQTKEGVDFLANGIGNDISKDKILVITNDQGIISWEFLLVNTF